MRLSKKLPLAAAILAIFAIGATSLTSLVISTQTSHQLVEERLQAIAVGSEKVILSYLASIEQDIIVQANDPKIKNAFDSMSFAWMTLGGNAREELQRRYIGDNPNPLGQKHLLDNAEVDGYDANHGRFHGQIRAHMEDKGYYDIFLMNPQGDIVYTVYKELDYATNLVTGKYRDSGLAQVFNEIVAGAGEKKTAFADFAPYAPSHGAPAAFIATPIMANGNVAAVLAFQMPIDKINEVMANATGLGELGEAVLINSEGYLLNDSAFSEENDILKTKLDAGFILDSIENQATTVKTYSEYRDLESNVAVAGFTFSGAKWGVAALMAQSEAFAGITKMRTLMLASAAVTILIALGAALLFSRTITKPIDRLVNRMRALAGGDTSIDINAGERSDEIGDMIDAVVVFRDGAVEKVALEGQAERDRSLSENERAEREAAKAQEAAKLNDAVVALGAGLQELASGNLTTRIDVPFIAELEGLRSDFNMSVEKLRVTLGDVQEGTTAISDDANELRSAADNLSRRTEQQAASLEETSAALDEITATVNNSTERAQEATRLVGSAKESTESSSKIVADAVDAMSRIENASDEISKIISVIDEIAFQTNLLALNAGVEAARAGEAGKGFAVVAQEVRELAQRAATAAKEIKDLITKSGEEVTGGVSLVQATGEALTEISGHVDVINEHINSIATAAEEQATGLREINSAVNQMDQVTQQNAAMVEETNAVTHRLSDGTKHLGALVTQFQISGQASHQNQSGADYTEMQAAS